MDGLQTIITMVFGGLVALLGIILFAVSKREGKSRVKLPWVEVEVPAPALIIFVVGCGLFVVPFFVPQPEAGPSKNPGDSPGIPLEAKLSANPTEGQAPLTVGFADESIGEPTAWKWSFDDGNSSDEQNPSHVYTEPGTYRVTLTVSRGNDISKTDRATVVRVTAATTVPVNVPEVTGRWVSKVAELLTTAGLKAKLEDDRIRLEDIPDGVEIAVHAQDPAPGSEVEPGSEVTLRIWRQVEIGKVSEFEFDNNLPGVTRGESSPVDIRLRVAEGFAVIDCGDGVGLARVPLHGVDPGGLLVMDVRGGFDEIHGLCMVDGDGIVAVGTAKERIPFEKLEDWFGLSRSVAFVRCTFDGRVDQDSGKSARVVDRRTDRRVNIVVPRADGKVVVGGSQILDVNEKGFPTRKKALAWQYNRFGESDASFRFLGKDVAARSQEVECMALAGDGRSVIVAFDHTGMTRHRLDGGLDDTFGDQGRARFPNSFSDPLDLAIQPRSGRIILLQVLSTTRKVAVTCWKSDGSRDVDFGDDGSVVLPELRTGKLAIQRDGKIVVLQHRDSTLSLFRFSTEGKRDTTFGDQGISGDQFPARSISPRTLLVQDSGQIVVGGTAIVALDQKQKIAPFLVRYDQSGERDVEFERDGETLRTLASWSVVSISNLVEQTDQKLLVGAQTGAPILPTDFAIARLLSDGGLDPTFARPYTFSDLWKGEADADVTERMMLENLPKDAYLLLRTNGGHFVLCRVDEAIDASVDRVKLSYMVWSRK